MDHADQYDRVKTLFRLVLVVPIAIVYEVLTADVTRTVYEQSVATVSTTSGGVVSGLFVATLLMIPFRRRYPRWWFDFALEGPDLSAWVAPHRLPSHRTSTHRREGRARRSHVRAVISAGAGVRIRHPSGMPAPNHTATHARTSKGSSSGMVPVQAKPGPTRPVHSAAVTGKGPGGSAGSGSGDGLDSDEDELVGVERRSFDADLVEDSSGELDGLDHPLRSTCVGVVVAGWLRAHSVAEGGG